MHDLKRICVNCGSSPGRRPEYTEAARALGQHLAENGIGTVFGGADVGLMGTVADAALDHGGEVIGVVPEAIVEKVGHHGRLTQVRVVATMHERKTLMFELSDAFIALPGGLGTLEEVLEILTWAQLDFHGKPCGFLNVCGYFDRLLEFLDHAVAERFVKPEHRSMLIVATAPAELLAKLRRYTAPTVTKWLDHEGLPGK